MEIWGILHMIAVAEGAAAEKFYSSIFI